MLRCEIFPNLCEQEKLHTLDTHITHYTPRPCYYHPFDCISNSLIINTKKNNVILVFAVRIKVVFCAKSLCKKKQLHFTRIINLTNACNS